jgi:hypothetical protein
MDFPRLSVDTTKSRGILRSYSEIDFADVKLPSPESPLKSSVASTIFQGPLGERIRP